MFWHGSPITRVEQLALKSFVFHGHQVFLHAYDEIKSVPHGVTLTDASKILPASDIFYHKRTGSIALFADWFRYKLIYEQGGIWVDTDIVCMRPFVFEESIVLGRESEEFLNNAVFGAPKGSEFAKWMADCCQSPNRINPYDSLATRIKKIRRKVFEGNRRDRIRWGEYGPKGITYASKYFGVYSDAQPISAFYPIKCDDWRSAFEPLLTGSQKEEIDFCYGVHLWNNMMRTASDFDKNGRFPDNSLFEQLWRQYFSS